ncbi:HWE histidine kinase domain-containing protein [Chelativorans sp.]|uniref:sensor histidine kinase n=1 Tax=Chelativorans sp. TaxID=2203393 RepID=UPI00281286FE|nr:HWE histidine kinase domain-containing protein [Chelativorans sp.]
MGDVDTGASRPDAEIRFGQKLHARLTGPKPIGFYLFLLIVVTIVPALAISAVLLQRNDEAQREIVETLAEAMAGSIAEAVDRELAGMETTLRVLSTTRSLTSGNLQDFYDRGKAALSGTGSYLIVLDENFRQLINTRVPFGSPLGVTGDPESAQRALNTRAPAISGVFFGRTSQNWVFNVVLPFLRENQPPRLLVLTRDADSMADALSQEMLRGGWNASLLDRNGIVIASSFMSSSVGKPFFLDISGSGAPQTARLAEDMNSESYLRIIRESRYSGWKVVVWAPTAAVEEPTRRALRFLFGGSLVIIAIGTLAAWLIGRQIAGPVRRLAYDARRLGAGQPVDAVRYPIAEVATVSAALSEASTDRKTAENEIRLLMREVAHRAKNQLTVVSSMAKQTARSSRSLPAFLDSFQKRLYGLARSTDLLIAGGATGVELRELLMAQIEPFRPEDLKRLDISGPPFRLSNQAAQTIGLAVHELATNAAKYGAFASRTGRLSVDWAVEGETLVLTWREHLALLRRRPAKRGFGTEIIERMLGGTLDAEISRTFHRDGLECVFRIPLKRLVPERTHSLASV